jgi:hypothetical protein
VKSHVWRPLYVVILIIAAVLVTRKILVPADFGIGSRGYMYGWHRPSNEQEWKEVSVKYRTAEYCKNCHGPALGHPDDPKTLPINRTRELCARCHFRLEYPTSGRGKIRGIDPKTHNPELECVTCHWPHDPRKAGHAAGKSAAAARNPNNPEPQCVTWQHDPRKEGRS